MFRFKFLIAFVSIFFSNSFIVNAQEIDRSLQQLQVDVVYLSSNLLKGRSTGSHGERLAAEYIASRFHQNKLKPLGNDGSYFQIFDFEYKANPHSAESGEKKSGINILGLIDNGAKHTVVIGAHFDHLGMGEFGSRHTGEPDIHNGADDNSSGVASMLFLLEKLSTTTALANNYLFIGFSGEELGLYGSKYFVSNPSVPLTSINYMLNMDMVGRLNDEQTLIINGTGTSPAWKEGIDKISTTLRISTHDSGIGSSDHTSFYLNDIPAVHFFTGQHADYHKPEDDSEFINYEGIKVVSDYIYQLIETLDGKGRLQFTKTKDETEGRRAAAFKVSLGVMPDYVYQGEGMKIDGVTEGKPAATAGLQKDDIIIKIGEKDIKNIYDYMDALGTLNKGETTRIALKRKDKVMVKNVTF